MNCRRQQKTRGLSTQQWVHGHVAVSMLATHGNAGLPVAQSSSEVIKPMHPFQMTLRIKQRKRPRRGFIFEHASQRRWPAQRCKTHAQLQQKCFRQIQNLRHGSFATTVGLFVEKPTLGGITWHSAATRACQYIACRAVHSCVLVRHP